MTVQNSRGMRDYGPAEMRKFRFIEDVFRGVAASWGYQEVRTPTLESLHLTGTRFTDAGLVHLKGLPRLRELTLHDTQLSDAGLEQLKGMTNLELLDLRAQVTPEGVSRLREALPECQMVCQIQGKRPLGVR